MTGNELRRLRKIQGLTQKALAEALGLKAQSIQKWEYCKQEQAEIHARYWPVLARSLAQPVDAFYPSNDDTGPVSDKEEAVQGTPGINLRPLERQVIELNREIGNDNILKGIISRLLKMKELTDDMCRSIS